MKSKFRKAAIVMLLAVLTLTITILTGCADGRAMTAEADLNFDGLASAPPSETAEKATPIDKSKITLSSETTTDQAVLDSIEYILRLTNQNHIDCEFFAAAAFGTGEASINGGTIIGAMDTREIKIYDRGEYYFDTYGLIVDAYSMNQKGKKGKVPDIIVNALSKALNYTKRTYSPDDVTFYTAENGSKTKKTIAAFPDCNAVAYKHPNVKKRNLEEFMKYLNAKISYKGFTTDNYDTERPITTGLLTYDEENGTYYLECTINCEDETLELSIADMLSNSAIKKFAYAEKILKIEIWECGLIKTYINDNVWNATLILDLKGSSINHYEQRFNYDKSKLDKMLIPQELKNALIV